MAKRFTDTNKYRKPFIRGLKGAYKLLWDFLYHDCDHAGIWIVDFDIAQLYIGKDMVINKKEALDFFNDGEIRIIELDNGSKWFLPSFIDFQYGKLNEKNKAHSGIINILNKYNLIYSDFSLRGFRSPLQGAMDKDKEMDKDKKSGKFNYFPILSDFNGLPEIKTGAVVQLFKITKQTDVSNTEIEGLWNIFKIQNLTGNKHYSNEDAVYSHFINWVKTQNIEKNGGQSTDGSNKSTGGKKGTSADRMEAARKW